MSNLVRLSLKKGFSLEIVDDSCTAYIVVSKDILKEKLAECDAVIHSIDGVSAGIKMIDEVNTPQDR